METQVSGLERLQPPDVADAGAYVVTRDRRVSVNEMLVRASEQTCDVTDPSAVPRNKST